MNRGPDRSAAEARRPDAPDASGVPADLDEPDDAGCILALPDAPEQALLEVYRGDKAHDFSGLSLQFRVPDIDAFAAALPADTAARGPVDRPWGSRYLYLTDPNGVAVIAYQGGY